MANTTAMNLRDKCLIDLPWDEYTSDSFNLKKVQKVLDRDHFGLEKVKERIVERRTSLLHLNSSIYLV